MALKYEEFMNDSDEVSIRHANYVLWQMHKWLYIQWSRNVLFLFFISITLLILFYHPNQKYSVYNLKLPELAKDSTFIQNLIVGHWAERFFTMVNILGYGSSVLVHIRGPVTFAILAQTIWQWNCHYACVNAGLRGQCSNT